MSHAHGIAEADLQPADIAMLDKIAGDLPIMADLCRADLLLYTLAGEGSVQVRAQARPRSSATLYPDDRVGASEPEVEVGGFRPQRLGVYRFRPLLIRGASVARHVFPLRNPSGELIAVLAQDAYWFAHERHLRRAKAFQRALLEFVWMVIHGRLQGATELSPFREHDGIMYVDPNGRIRYLSGICAEIYRHIGYRESLVNWHVGDLYTVDRQMVQDAISTGRAFEQSVEEGEGLYVRKVLPIVSQDLAPWRRAIRAATPDAQQTWHQRGAFLLIRDATEAFRTQRELESQMAIVREVHHRVKNNLQVIASIMRMQSRRATLAETREALDDAVQRILGVAVVHEFLSQQAEGTTINLREVTSRIIAQVQRSLLSPDKGIEVSLNGPDIWLPAERATLCALIVNELVQNAIEHGMDGRAQGRIVIDLVDEGGGVRMVVTDNGRGLGDGFVLSEKANLGLTLVRSMATRDLRGSFDIESAGQGTRAVVTFDK